MCVCHIYICWSSAVVDRLQTCEWRQKDILFTLHQKGEVESLTSLQWKKNAMIGSHRIMGNFGDGWWYSTSDLYKRCYTQLCHTSPLVLILSFDQSVEFHTEIGQDSSECHLCTENIWKYNWSFEKCFLVPGLSSDELKVLLISFTLSIHTCSVSSFTWTKQDQVQRKFAQS